MKLTPKQKELINIAEQKGYFTLDDARIIYSSDVARINAIDKLILMNLIDSSKTLGKFILIKSTMEVK